jgi:predicted nuclease with TOPRIM domain
MVDELEKEETSRGAISAEFRSILAALSEIKTKLNNIEERLRVSELSSEKITSRLENGNQRFGVIDERLKRLTEEQQRIVLEMARLQGSMALLISRDTLDLKLGEVNREFDGKISDCHKLVNARAAECVSKESLRYLLSGASLAGGTIGAVAGKLLGLF